MTRPVRSKAIAIRTGSHKQNPCPHDLLLFPERHACVSERTCLALDDTVPRMSYMRALLAGSLLVASSTGCTVVNTVQVPSTPGTAGSDVFVTSGDIAEPHEVLGMVQVHKGGVLLFGNIDIIGTDLEAGFKDVLIPEVKKQGGDGVVRVRYQMTQYTPGARVLGAIFFIFPLPSGVTITGQVVKMKPGAAAPAMPPPAAAPPAAAPATTPEIKNL